MYEYDDVFSHLSLQLLKTIRAGDELVFFRFTLLLPFITAYITLFIFILYAYVYNRRCVYNIDIIVSTPTHQRTPYAVRTERIMLNFFKHPHVGIVWFLFLFFLYYFSSSS